MQIYFMIRDKMAILVSAILDPPSWIRHLCHAILVSIELKK